MENRYLFRAKRIDNGEWVEGNYVHTRLGREMIADGTTYFGINRPCMIDIDVKTLCQCTGLKDRNGKLIWENDVITISAYDYLEPTDDYTGIVCYSEKDVCWCLKDFENEEKIIPICECYGEYVTEITKLGNIFDNPELLEQEG